MSEEWEGVGGGGVGWEWWWKVARMEVGGQYPHATVFLPLRNCSSLMGSEDVVSKIKIIIITFMC